MRDDLINELCGQCNLCDLHHVLSHCMLPCDMSDLQLATKEGAPRQIR